MKPYEKPKLIALSLAGNERLCGDCLTNGAKILLSQDPKGIVAWYLDLVGGDGNGELTKSEMEKIFSTTDSCARATNGEFYCKFTGAFTVAWS